jgi:hypothetical protein
MIALIGFMGQGCHAKPLFYSVCVQAPQADHVPSILSADSVKALNVVSRDARSVIDLWARRGLLYQSCPAQLLQQTVQGMDSTFFAYVNALPCLRSYFIFYLASMLLAALLREHRIRHGATLGYVPARYRYHKKHIGSELAGSIVLK